MRSTSYYLASKSNASELSKVQKMLNITSSHWKAYSCKLTLKYFNQVHFKEFSSHMYYCFLNNRSRKIIFLISIVSSVFAWNTAISFFGQCHFSYNSNALFSLYLFTVDVRILEHMCERRVFLKHTSKRTKYLWLWILKLSWGNLCSTRLHIYRQFWSSFWMGWVHQLNLKSDLLNLWHRKTKKVLKDRLKPHYLFEWLQKAFYCLSP